MGLKITENENREIDFRTIFDKSVSI